VPRITVSDIHVTCCSICMSPVTWNTLLCSS